MTSDDIRKLIIIGVNGERNPTGLQQDCLGMTPLHILTCSTVHSLELYQLMIDEYPENLIIKDEWGALPLLYAVGGTHQVRLFISLSIGINLSTRITNSIGATW